MFRVRLGRRRRCGTYLDYGVRGGPEQTSQRAWRFQTSTRVNGFGEGNDRLVGNGKASKVSLGVLLVVLFTDLFKCVAEGALVRDGATRLTDAQRRMLQVEEVRPRRCRIVWHEARQLSCYHVNRHEHTYAGVVRQPLRRRDQPRRRT